MSAENAKRVAVFVTGAFSSPDRLDSISGHVQIPLMAARMLCEAGHDVTLVTTKEHHVDRMPYRLPPALKVCVVQHASRPSPEHRIYPGKALRQIGQLLALIRKKRFDAIHFFGGAATGWLLCALKSFGVQAQAFYSPIKAPPTAWSDLKAPMIRWAFKKVTRVLATSDHVTSGWAPIVGQAKVQTLHPGITRRHRGDSPPGGEKDAVLFWRCARHDNGVDVAMASFRQLALRHPATRFVFAVRPYGPYENDLSDLARRTPNIDLHVYPYNRGVSLTSLLTRAHFVVQPFRRLTVNPQFCILESLYAGLPVIATDVESNSELVYPEQSGLLVPPGDEAALSAAIDRLLGDRQFLARLTRNARPMTERHWNWDVFGQELVQTYDRHCPRRSWAAWPTPDGVRAQSTRAAMASAPPPGSRSARQTEPVNLE